MIFYNFFIFEEDISSFNTLSNLVLKEDNYYFVFIKNDNFESIFSTLKQYLVCELLENEPTKGKFQVVQNNKSLFFKDNKIVVGEINEQSFALNYLFEKKIEAVIFLFNFLDEYFLRFVKKLKLFNYPIFMHKSINEEFGDIDDVFEDINLFVKRFEQKKDIDISDEAKQSIAEIIEDYIFIDISYYNDAKIKEAIKKRMQILGMIDTKIYVEKISNDMNEFRAFLNMLFDSATMFFHEEIFHEEIKNALEEILKVKYNEIIRIWVCGCGSGEEAVFVALMLQYLINRDARNVTFQIFATDIYENAISFGVMPSWSNNDIKDLNFNLVDMFLKKEGRVFLDKEIKENIIFTVHDVVHDTLFTAIDLILCLNLLDDFKPDITKKVENIFNKALNIDGFLITNSKHEFEKVRFKKISENTYKNCFYISPNDNLSLNQDDLIKTLIAQSVQGSISYYLLIDKEKKVISKNGDLSFFFDNYSSIMGKDITEYAKEFIKYELETIIDKTIQFGSPLLERVLYMGVDNRPRFLNINTTPLPKNNIAQDIILITFSTPKNYNQNNAERKKVGIKFR